MVNRGSPTISWVLRQAVIPAPVKVAEQRGINPGTPVVELQRLRCVEGGRIGPVTSYLPSDRCSGLENADFTEQALYACLEQTYY